MLRNLILAGAAVVSLGNGAAYAAGAEAHNRDFAFSFEGPFGTFDQNQLQRGLQVYTEICSSCHGLKFVPIRTLADQGGPHLPEEQVRDYAKNWEVWDPALRDTRTAEVTDNFPMSSMETAPDLSLMAKARAGFHGPYGTGLSQLVNGIGGPEHIVSILTGYSGETKEQAGTTLYENHAFPGGWIAMPPPLSGGEVEFRDGAPNDLESMSKDVAAFLMWTAEPKMMARKEAGLTAVLFLVVLTVLLYLTNKQIWMPVKKKAKEA